MPPTQQLGERVELEPYLDRWMQGDRFGSIVRDGRPRGGRHTVWVRLDLSGQERRFFLNDVRVL